MAKDGIDGLDHAVEVPRRDTDRAGNRVCLKLETDLDHI